jgi:oxygen-independent coproporphyrinogen-3 oxidase
VAVSAEDRFRAELIERLMCDLEVDLGEVARRHHRALDDLAPAVEDLAPFADDGVITLEGGRLAMTDLGRPFLRSVCAVFDQHLERAAPRHSSVV